MDKNITQWIGKLKSGEEEAAAAIWSEYFPRVCGLARKKLGDLKKRTFDEEDLALSAINALCMGAQAGKFRQLESSDDLWQVLAMITTRKAAQSWRKGKRDPEQGESIISRPGRELAGIDHLAGKADPDFIDQLSVTSAELLGGLDEKLRKVALLRLQGYSNEEIAERQNRSVKSIERYMRMIREQWNQEADG